MVNMSNKMSICHGRLFDIITDSNSDSFDYYSRFKLSIKCWKCHSIIEFKKEYKELLSTSITYYL